jgi:glycosyltransferase involved in cell wall biosynthesis
VLEATPVPPELERLPRPVVGFFGLIADWVDLDLMGAVAKARPDWSIVLVGKVDTDTAPIDGLPNVHLFGWRDYRSLPSWCRGFDVATLPFRVNRLTLAANPLKLREYLAAGLPVVATAIPEAARLQPAVSVGSSAGDFVRAIEGLLARGEVGPSVERSRAMDGESWDAKVEAMSSLVERFLDHGRRDEAPAGRRDGAILEGASGRAGDGALGRAGAAP